jgi:hypothetical protein
VAELRRIVDGLNFRHAELLRRQAGVLTEENEATLLAPALCLYASETLGGNRDAAVVAAASLALLEAMAAAFEGLDGNVLSRDWGLPRALNAGDGFYVQAQRNLLRLRDHGLDDSHIYWATVLLDGAAWRIAEELYERVAPEGAPPAGRPVGHALMAPALAFAAMLADGDQAVVDAFAHDDSDDNLEAMVTGDDARQAVAAALRYIREVTR